MKRLIALLAAGCVVGALGVIAAETVYSRNIAGIVRKSVPPNGQVLVSMALKNIDTGTNTLMSIFGANQLLTNKNYLVADRVMLWELGPPARYHSYAQWTNFNFYGCNTLTEWIGRVATNPVVPPGASFWIVRGAGATDTNTISFSGEVIQDATGKVDIVTGYQLVSYPFSGGIDMQSINTNGMRTNKNYLLADTIVTWETNQYQRYALWTNGYWYKCNTLTEWINKIPSTRVLEVGEGMWFIAQNNFTWTETNRYLGALQQQ